RGFARVEQRDAEEFELGEDTELFQAPVLTLSWFHTGAWLEKERLELALQAEYSQDGPPALLVPDTVFPDTDPPGGTLSIQDLREATRALRGRMLRQEIYAEDGSAEAENPYVITEQNFQVRRLQPSRGELRYGVFYAFAREAVSISTERNPSDPRVSHQFTLDVDVFGNVTRQASISYGRQGTVDDETVFDEQKQAWATLTE